MCNLIDKVLLQIVVSMSIIKEYLIIWQFIRNSINNNDKIQSSVFSQFKLIYHRTLHVWNCFQGYSDIKRIYLSKEIN